MDDINDFSGVQTDRIRGETFCWGLREDQSATENTQTENS